MKKTFIFYTDWIDYTEEMNREEKWLFLETILAFQNGEDLPSDITPIKFIWSRVKKQLEDDNIKWSSELDKRKKAGKLWGLAKASKWKQVLASASKWKQLLADNVNVNDNVNKNDKKQETNIKYFSNQLLNNLFLDFIEFRKEIKKPITKIWIKQNVSKINKWIPEYWESWVITFIENSITNGYQWIFEDKNLKKVANEKKVTYNLNDIDIW